jgi:hypothetical protein
MLLNHLLKLENSPLLSVENILQSLLFGKCSLMDPLQEKVLVLEWSLFHLFKRLYLMSYKLEFETTNNVAEYEALVLGLRAAKTWGSKRYQCLGMLS